MNSDEPIAFFITWTVYGTHLQGDVRGWRKRQRGPQTPQPLLAQWRRERLKHSIDCLDRQQRQVVDDEITRLAAYRQWHLWTRSVRSNHVHVVVTAIGMTGGKVRDQLKANATRVLRERWAKFVGRPVWTRGGDWQCIHSEEDLEEIIRYVGEAQDRKGIVR